VAAARVDECHTVKRRNIYSLSQAARIAQHCALVGPQLLEPVELDLALARRHVAGDEIGMQVAARPMLVAYPVGYLLKFGDEAFRATDPAVKADDALEVIVLHRLEQADLGCERCAVRLHARARAHQLSLVDPLRDGGVVYADDDDTVVGEQLALDGFAEWQRVHHVAEQGPVVHADDFDATSFRSALHASGIDPGRGRREKPFGAADLFVVENGTEVTANFARTAVCLVRDGKVKGGDVGFALRGSHHQRRLVGREDNAVATAAEKLPYFRRIGRDTKGKVHHAVNGIIARLAADAVVGTDAKQVEGDRCRMRPLAQQLRQ
jgi:hypothetical protein